MDNVIAVRVQKAVLTKAQQKIADYCIRNPERVGICSSMEVAKAIGVSDASITRFARAIGYEGFADLKNDIYCSIAKEATGGVNSLSLAERFEHNRAEYGARDSQMDYVKMLEYNLERTMQQNEEEKFEKAVDILLQAKHRYVVGFRGCLGAAEQCAWLLRFLVDHIVAVSDEGPGGIGSLQDAGPEDSVLMFSVSRYYKCDLRIAQLSHKRGAKLCIVTDSVLSPLAELADVLLVVETKHMSFFNSCNAMNMIYEYLVAKLAERRLDVCMDRVNERDALTEDLRL